MGKVKADYFQKIKADTWFLSGITLGVLIKLDTFLEQDCSKWYLPDMEDRIISEIGFFTSKVFEVSLKAKENDYSF